MLTQDTAFEEEKGMRIANVNFRFEDIDREYGVFGWTSVE